MIGGPQSIHSKNTINIASEILQFMLHMGGYERPNALQK